MHEEAMGRKGVRRQDVMSFCTQLLANISMLRHTHKTHASRCLGGTDADEVLLLHLLDHVPFIFDRLLERVFLGPQNRSRKCASGDLPHMVGHLVGIVTRTNTRVSPRDFASWPAKAGYLACQDMFEAS